MDIIGILKTVVVGLFKAYFWLPTLAMDFCAVHFGSIGVLVGFFAFMLILFVQAYLLGIIWILLGGRVSVSTSVRNETEDFYDEAEDFSKGDEIDEILNPNLFYTVLPGNVYHGTEE